MAEAAFRLQQSVRPLDTVARVGDREFAVLMLHAQGEPPHPSAFRRLHRTLGLRAYKTSDGFVDRVVAPVSVVAFGADAVRGLQPAAVLDLAREGLARASTDGTPVLQRMSAAHYGSSPSASHSR